MSFGRVFLTLQIPITDLRCFVGPQTNRLIRPTWPLPDPRKEFVRSFGNIRERRNGGVEFWPGEEVFCSARRAIKFQCDVESVLRTKGIEAGTPFRRLQSNGRSVTRFEVLFWVADASGSSEAGLIDGCLSLPVRVGRPLPAGSFSGPLVGCGDALACYYRYATTARPVLSTWHKVSQFLRNCFRAQPNTDSWTGPGTPLLMAMHSTDEDTEVGGREIPLGLPRVRLFSARLEIAGCPVNTWFLKCGAACEPGLLRALRIHLARLYAERECLKHVLRTVARQQLRLRRDTPESNLFQEYLTETARFLERSSYSGIKQGYILAAANESDSFVSAGERASLLYELKSIRRNLYHRIEKLTDPQPNFRIQGQTVIVGDVETVQDVRNMDEYNFNNSQVGAAGPQAKAERNQFQQANTGALPAGMDSAALLRELARLAAEMRKSSTEVDHDEAVVNVGKAQKALSAGDSKGAMQYLKDAGTWALDIATKIGVPLAVEVLKQSLGIPK